MQKDGILFERDAKRFQIAAKMFGAAVCGTAGTRRQFLLL
jgi:hypothetical protein